MKDYSDKIKNKVPIEKIQQLIDEGVYELMNLSEPPEIEKVQSLLLELVFDRVKKLLPDDHLIMSATKKVIIELIGEIWGEIKDQFISLSEKKSTETEIEYVDYSTLPDISSNPSLYLDYMKSQEFDEDQELRKYVEIQLNDLEKDEKDSKKIDFKTRIEEIRRQAQILTIQKDFFRQNIKPELQRFAQKIEIKNLPEKELFEMIHKEIEQFNYLTLLLDEENLKMQFGGYLMPLKGRVVFEVEIIPPNLILKIYSQKSQNISELQDRLEKIITIIMDNLEKINVSSNLIYINIKNAFNTIDELLILFYLCNKGSIEKVHIKLGEIKVFFEGKLKLLKLTETLENLQATLIKNIESEEFDANLKAEIRFLILNWIREILFFAETNIRNYIDIVKIEEIIDQIQTELRRIREELNNSIQIYEKEILHYLLIMGKYNGLSYFSHPFKEIEFNPNLLSGLLSAIQTFGYQIMSSKASIKNLQYEGFNIYLFYGEDIVTALITKGQIIGPLFQKLEGITKQFEHDFKEELIEFDGKLNVFEDAFELVPKFF
ncbi:MAG: hypothetical protein ACFFCM_00870 [Promethearchaeota archaeon]